MKNSFLFLLSILFIVSPAYAHEAYVLPHNDFQAGMQIDSQNPLAPLVDPTHFQISVAITVIVALIYFLSIIWSTTKTAGYLDKFLKSIWLIGPLTIRLAVAISFYFSANGNDFLGPELTLNTIPGGAMIRFLLYLLSLLILLGLFTELAALIGLLIFIYATRVFGAYMITYANYFAELTVLFLFGSKFMSVDYLFSGKKLWIKILEKYKALEIPLVRICYGIGLIYAGYTIKFLHQDLSISVYNQYHLQNFFHASGNFVAAGAGLSEILIGLFILLGFAQRLTIFISVVFITLSLLYFREMLWPHLILYGISFSLFINSADKFTLDRYLIPWAKRILKLITRNLKLRI